MVADRPVARRPAANRPGLGAHYPGPAWVAGEDSAAAFIARRVTLMLARSPSIPWVKRCAATGRHPKVAGEWDLARRR